MFRTAHPTAHLLNLLETPSSAEGNGSLADTLHALLKAGDPLAFHNAVAAAIRLRVDAGARQPIPEAGWLERLLRALPESFTAPPELNAPTPEASLCETLMLAVAASGEALGDSLEAVAAGARALEFSRAWRLGQIILRDESDKPNALILPALASLLVADVRATIKDRASELAWDLLLRDAAAGPATAAQLARLALGSPARLLARSPEALRSLSLHGNGVEGGPADDSPERLLGAAGLSEGTPFSAAAPGRSGRGQRDDADGIPVEALLLELSTAPTAWRRSEALLRLLRREPTGIIAGVEVNLRREASVHIASALHGEISPQLADADLGFRRADWLRLEVAALRHGAVLASRTVPDDVPRRVRAAWLIGDWIGRVLRESPFFGADPGLLSARLEAALPAVLPLTEDALWPAAIGTDSSSIRLDELWLLHALLLAGTSWQPPSPVLEGLRRLAGRTLNSAEYLVEQHLEQQKSTLEWPGQHIAPPLAARWLLHVHQAEWLASLPHDAQIETLNCLERWLATGLAPRGTWVMLALYRDARRLADLERRSYDIWTSVADRASDPFATLGDALAPFCLWGSTLLPVLTPRHAALLSSLAERTPTRWRVGVLAALAGASTEAHDVSAAARQVLLRLIRSESEPSLHLPAAIATVQTARKLLPAEREDLLDRVVTSVGEDLRAHPSLRMELKRAGRILQ
jgi:hypothetical protein